jgi:hypothetical protein
MGIRGWTARHYRNGTLWASTPIVVKAGYALMVYLVSVGLLVGGGILIAISSHVWQNAALAYVWGICFGPVAIVFFVFKAFEAADGRGRDAFCLMALAFGAIAVMALPFVWRTALDAQALRDRGVIETAVVVAVHSQTDGDPDDTVYSYTLHSIHGPPIRRDLGTGSRDEFTVGQRVTVFADPSGESAPSLQLRPPGNPWVAPFVLTGFAAVAMLFAPWPAASWAARF